MKHFLRSLLFLLALSLFFPVAADAAKRKTSKSTNETKDVKVEEIGVLQDDDVRVVQKMKYVKKGNHEVGFIITTQPWNAYVGGVMAGLNVTFNPLEQFGIELAVLGGYGWGNGHWQDVTFLAGETSLTGLGTDAARQLAGGHLNIVWSPIYGKFAWGGRKVGHFDINFTLGGHGFFAQRLEANAGFRALAGPSLGIGAKIFLTPKAALKIDLRDHISLETRTYTGKFTARNNFQFGIGVAFYPTVGK
jgi:outer membrane beta-barrel protein